MTCHYFRPLVQQNVMQSERLVNAMKTFRLPFSKSAAAFAVFVGFLLAAPGAFAGSQINVPIDQVVAFNIDRPAESIFIGNPAIASVHSLTKQQFQITGIGSGTTNLIALDGNGKEITNVMIRVSPPSTQRVVLHKATAQSTYSCSSSCELTPMIGDDPAVFNSLIDQGQSKMQAASRAKNQTGE